MSLSFCWSAVDREHHHRIRTGFFIRIPPVNTQEEDVGDILAAEEVALIDVDVIFMPCFIVVERAHQAVEIAAARNGGDQDQRNQSKKQLEQNVLFAPALFPAAFNILHRLAVSCSLRRPLLLWRPPVIWILGRRPDGRKILRDIGRFCRRGPFGRLACL